MAAPRPLAQNYPFGLLGTSSEAIPGYSSFTSSVLWALYIVLLHSSFHNIPQYIFYSYSGVSPLSLAIIRKTGSFKSRDEFNDLNPSLIFSSIATTLALYLPPPNPRLSVHQGNFGGTSVLLVFGVPSSELTRIESFRPYCPTASVHLDT